MTNRLQILQLDPDNSQDILLVKTGLLDFMKRQEFSLLYPDFVEWYQSKIIPGFQYRERLIHIVMNNHNICGTSIVKLSPTETKLCNLVIAADFRKKGIGAKLLESSLKATTEIVKKYGYSPIIMATVAYEHRSLLGFLEKFGFTVKNTITGIYRKGVDEYILSADL